jgi:hypothetical protein
MREVRQEMQQRCRRAQDRTIPLDVGYEWAPWCQGDELKRAFELYYYREAEQTR